VSPASSHLKCSDVSSTTVEGLPLRGVSIGVEVFDPIVPREVVSFFCWSYQEIDEHVETCWRCNVAICRRTSGLVLRLNADVDDAALSYPSHLQSILTEKKNAVRCKHDG